MEKEESEFGKGFVYCLILFSKHWWKLQTDKKVYESIGRENDAYEMWFYGASDHLFELEVPEMLKGSRIDDLTQEFKTFALRLRLPMDGERTATPEDYKIAFEKVEEIAMLVDKWLGGEPVKAQWN
jgi:hypothetical protein